MSLGNAQSFYEVGPDLLPFDLTPVGRSRFLLGGTHFWGHADFYIAIPVWNGVQREEFAQVRQGPGVETGFKYYPWRIQRKRLAPYLGFGITPFGYQQDQMLDGEVSAHGASITRVRYPLFLGLTGLYKNHLIELGATWNYDRNIDYYIRPEQKVAIQMSPWQLALAYKYMLDTTQGAEKAWDRGDIAKITEQRKKDGSLNGFFLGIGLSSAWFLRTSEYLEQAFPWVDQHKIAAPFPDVTLGYLWNPPDIHLHAVYRSFRSAASAHGDRQLLRRRSLGLEAIKGIGDYHGFVPFIGPVLSHEWVTGTMSVDGEDIWEQEQQTWQAGITFGWDIRPTHLDWFFLRTNLRYYPRFQLRLENDQTIPLDQIEFNFIQMVVYFNRAASQFKK